MFQLKALPRNLGAAQRDVRDRNPAVRRSALRDLVRLSQGPERESALDSLCCCLREDELSELRADAALALADAEARNKWEPLLAATDDSHASVRQMALLALGELCPRGHRGATRAIERALGSEVAAIRFQALLAGQKLGLLEWSEQLTRSVTDSDAKIRYLALRLIDERAAEAESSPPGDIDEWEDAVRPLLDDSDAQVRVAAAFLLAPSGDRCARDILVSALNQGVKLPAPEDEQNLIEMAGELGLADAAPGLTRHAFGLFGLVPGRFAFQARIALARVGDPRARREILRGLRSWDRDARTLAVVAVGQARLHEAKSELQSMASADRADAAALRDALRALE